MIEVTLAIAILLTGGIVFAKCAQLLNLPSVTGFIFAGLILGPSGFSLITAESVGHNLDHFTQIALMLIAFGVGEHVELRRLGGLAAQVITICLTQAFFCLLWVIPVTLLTAWILTPELPLVRHLILALILGAIALAGAPAAILHLVREYDARGPLTSTLMAVIALGDALAVIIFGITLSIAHQLVGQGETSLINGVLGSLSEIGGSIAIGAVTGFLIDFVLHKTHHKGEMLTAGLALLLLCGEITHLLHLSPLLAGMTAGCIMVNREERDVRLFRILNGFEPPVYVLFFTLAGVHLDLALLQQAGWIGLAYFIARICGKYTGSRLGAILTKAPEVVRRFLGFGLIPQAGMAIGLVFVISSDPLLASWSTDITPVVLAGVVLSELLGPVLAGKAFFKADEVADQHKNLQETPPGRLARFLFSRSAEVSLAPWTGGTLQPAPAPEGFVIFGAANYATVRGLARVATVLAHHLQALPLSLRVMNTDNNHPHMHPSADSIFLPETDEIQSLGYPLHTLNPRGAVVDELISAIEEYNTKALVLGYPLGKNPLAIRKVVDKVISNVTCPVVVVRFIGTFSCDRILVPFLDSKELDSLLPIIGAMAGTYKSSLTLMQLCETNCTRVELRNTEDTLNQWIKNNLPATKTVPLAVAAGSRLEAVLQQAQHHDLLIIKAGSKRGLRQLFSGSLANAIVINCKNPVFAVYQQQEKEKVN